MTRHLTSEQFIDALERVLPTECQAHLATCTACASELADMRFLMSDVVAAGQVPEPSPLFWDHLSARVRGAVQAAPAPLGWWQAMRRPLVLAGSVMAVLAVVVLLRGRPTDVPTGAESSASRNEAAVSGESDVAWAMISAMAPSIPEDDAREAGLTPGRAVTDAAIESLTQSQRQALMKLLRAEMGAAE